MKINKNVVQKLDGLEEEFLNTTLKNGGIMSAIRDEFGPAYDTDSYKLSHSAQYPPNTTRMMSYIESRGGLFNRVIVGGIQLQLLEYFVRPITHEQVSNMKEFAANHGTPFDEACWRKVVDVYNGIIPIRIRAVKEGTLVPTKNVICTIESVVDDPDVFHLVSYFETKILRIWTTTTVATISFNCKAVIKKYLDKTCMNPDAEISHRLNDFGSRGTTCDMQSAFSGVGHLFSFMGTDNIPSVAAARYGYFNQMAGHSIAASEHSTVCANGKGNEKEFILRMIEKFGDRGIFACVSDTWDIENCVKNVWCDPEVIAAIKKAGCIGVVRPDSNDPVKMPIQVLYWLAEGYGYTVNDKGYKVLNNVRVIQGDGLSYKEICQLCEDLERRGWSIENVAFGMGGGLLQKNDRDTQKFAMKGCAYLIDGKWVPAFKSPVNLTFGKETPDGYVISKEHGKSFKRSKAGRQTLFSRSTPEGIEYKTVCIDDIDEYQYAINAGFEEALEDVFDNGEIMRLQTLDEIRAIVDSELKWVIDNNISLVS